MKESSWDHRQLTMSLGTEECAVVYPSGYQSAIVHGSEGHRLSPSLYVPE